MAQSSPLRTFPQFKSWNRLNSLNDKVDTPFYDVKFYPYTEPGVDPVFAVVGGREAIVCRPSSGDSGGIDVIAWLHDEDPDESLNSLTWSQDGTTGDPLLIVSGTSPIIKVFDVKTKTLIRTLVGHGKGVNDLAVSPLSPQILASASMDKSVRFWSLDPAHSAQPTMLIAGGEGHKESILTFAFHSTGRFLLTGGMDHVINLWLLPTLPDEATGTDHPTTIHYPHFSSSAIHTDYVDCVQWHNDLILSKCAREQRVVLWCIEHFSSADAVPPAFYAPTTHEFRPTRSAWNGSFQRLLEFANPDCDLFFIRFNLWTGPPPAPPKDKKKDEAVYESPYAPASAAPRENGAVPVDRPRPILAVGNEKSKISFWDLARIGGADGDAEDEPRTGAPRGRKPKLRGGGQFGSAHRSGARGTPPSFGTSSPAHSGASVPPPASSTLSAPFAHPFPGSVPGPSTEPRTSTGVPLPSATGTGAPAGSSAPAPIPTPVSGPAPRKPSVRSDPFTAIPAHRAVTVTKKMAFTVRQIAWSADGAWMVGVGDGGVVALFGR